LGHATGTNECCGRSFRNAETAIRLDRAAQIAIFA
jgi:hypothetical protein